MSVEKLRTWLQLRDGPWPPSHYALIGLADGAGTSEEIEARVLERLERLRRYQLPHPEEATVGMNLLAKALDCLTNPESRRSYDRSLGLVPSEPEAVPEPVDDLLSKLFAEGRLLPTPGTIPAESILPESISLPSLDDEIDLDEEPAFADMPDVVLVELDEDDDGELPAAIILPEPKLLPEAPPAPSKSAKLPPPLRKVSDRPRSRARELYADLARIRKVLRLWERARPYMSDLERTLNRRTDSLALLGWLAELRPLLPTVSDLIGYPQQPGNIVAALARQRLVLDMFRTLLPSQRDALAKDFRAAHYRLAEEYNQLRAQVRRRTEKDFVRATWNPLLKHLAHYPEWFLLLMGMMILLVAILRSYYFPS